MREGERKEENGDLVTAEDEEVEEDDEEKEEWDVGKGKEDED